jgi:putative DNA primase/helicase
MAQAAALELGSARQGDQIGALLAGAYALQHQQAPSLEQARAWVKASGVREQSEGQADERGGDQGDCLQTILQSRLRIEAGKDGTFTRTVAELIETASRWKWQISEREPGLDAPADHVNPTLAIAELGRNGIAVRTETDELLISNTAKGIARMLAGTPWANGGWSTLLASLPGSKRHGVTRFRGLASTTRAVSLPSSLLLPSPVTGP